MNAIQKINQFIQDKTPLDYKGKRVILDKISERDGEVSILAVVDSKHQTFIKESGEKLDIFLLNFKEIPDPEPETKADTRGTTESAVALSRSRQTPQSQNLPGILQKHQNTFEKLSFMLLDDIEKVRQDPAYVAQAKQVANTANALINLAKLELEMVTKG